MITVIAILAFPAFCITAAAITNHKNNARKRRALAKMDAQYLINIANAERNAQP